MKSIRNTWNSTTKFFYQNDPVQKKSFRIFHVCSITITYIVVLSLIIVDKISSPIYEGNKTLELIMTSVQFLEPLFTITSILLIFKGNKNFYFYTLFGQAIILVTQGIQGLWMGVIRSGIQILVATVTYITWGKQRGKLEIKKATLPVWSMIIAGFLVVALLPGFLIQNFAKGTVFEPPNVWLGWLDSITFSLTMISIVLNIKKYREARLVQFVAGFFWPVILFTSEIWIFAINSLFFFVVSVAGLGSWYYIADNPIKEASPKIAK